MDLPDKNLDAWIEMAVQPAANLTPQQKQYAWERLSQSALQQSILPSTLMLEEKSYAIRLCKAGEVLWRWFAEFAIEEERYERARRNRHLMRYQSISAHGELTIQFLVPLRLSI
jgi:hypothetical protein